MTLQEAMEHAAELLEFAAEQNVRSYFYTYKNPGWKGGSIDEN
jgi:hypothetical protein